jgi:hypothetical protein
MGARAGVGVGALVGALPGLPDWAERGLERVALAVPAACCATGTDDAVGPREEAGWPELSGRCPCAPC